MENEPRIQDDTPDRRWGSTYKPSKNVNDYIDKAFDHLKNPRDQKKADAYKEAYDRLTDKEKGLVKGTGRRESDRGGGRRGGGGTNGDGGTMRGSPPGVNW